MSHRLSKKELDKQFELFLKESVSDDSVDLGSDTQPGCKSSQPSAQKLTTSWWHDEEHGDEGTSSAKSRYLKSKNTDLENHEETTGSPRRSQPIYEEQEDLVGSLQEEEEELLAALGGRDVSERGAHVNRSSVGLDTLEEEEEEKARFFAQLEAAASSRIDYAQLNRELDSTGSSCGTNLRNVDEAAGPSDDQREAGAASGSPHYSDDFEDEEKGKEETKTSPICAEVALSDSLDDDGEDRRKDTAGSLDRGASCVPSGGSEMEALHHAYRQIHIGDGSDELSRHHQPEWKGRSMDRPVSPSPCLQHTNTPPASTAESDLPTADELMKLVRPEDYVRGFSLQPVGSEQLDKEKPFCVLERTFQVVTSPEPHHKPTGPTDSAALKRSRTLEDPSSSGGSGPPIQDVTWSIREEVERLMQESAPGSSQTHRAMKQPQLARGTAMARGSTMARPSLLWEKRPSVAAARGRRVESRAAVGSRSSGSAPAVPPGRRPSSGPRPLRPSSTATKTRDKEDGGEVRVGSELVASVQSLVSVLQQQMDVGSHQDATDASDVRAPREDSLVPVNDEDASVALKELRVQLAEKEKELQKMKQVSEELYCVRQQNYVLQSKLHSAEEARRKMALAGSSDAATEEKLKQMHKEMEEQETLIRGFQQENEKLCVQMKAQQANSKANEEAMFRENQRLLNELAYTREQLSKSSRPQVNVCSMDHTQRIADLLAQINLFKRSEAQLREVNGRLKQENHTLRMDVELLTRERDSAEEPAVATSGERTSEVRVLQEKHREEVETLKKKLLWFAENQELLDRDASRLKAATAEIQQLKEQVEKLKADVSKRSREQQRKVREKSVDTKRMQDLERQVKELEQILRRRNPNSLPALIYAAAAADSQDKSHSAATSSHVNALLERRTQRLEAELERRDEEAKCSLRAMEQQFHRVKLRYEEQISELEQKLEQKLEQSSCGPEPAASRVGALEEELQRAKDAHQLTEKSLREQIETLQQQLRRRQAQPCPGRHQRQAEEAFGARINRLNQELATKTRSIQELSHMVDKLQREQRNMLCAPVLRHQPHRTAETRHTPAETTHTPTEETFPAAQYDKTYQPTVFTGTHISEVLQEKEALQERLELLELHTRQEHAALKSRVAGAEDELVRLKEISSQQLSSLKAQHLRELERLHAAYAMQHSSSEVARLTNELQSEEVRVKHLQHQLQELQGAKEALAVSRTREETMQTQLSRLLTELKEAKEAQGPEGKLLCSLERKIANMELRHQHREKELQQVIGSSWLEVDQQSQVDHWRRVAQDRSRELEGFRLELDAILDILRQLQRQGVVLPTPEPIPSAPLAHWM